MKLKHEDKTIANETSENVMYPFYHKQVKFLSVSNYILQVNHCLLVHLQCLPGIMMSQHLPNIHTSYATCLILLQKTTFP